MTIMQFTEFDLYALSEIMERRASPATDNSFTWSSVTWEDVMINRWLQKVIDDSIALVTTILERASGILTSSFRGNC